LDGFLDEGESLVHRAPDFASGSVLVASATEELGGQFIAGEVINGTQADADAGVLGVFTQEDGQFYAQDLQGEVDETFGVAVEDAEAAALGVGEGHDGGVGLLPDIEFYVEHIALELHAVGAVGEEDVAVDFVFVDATAEEDADELEDLRAGTGVGEGAGVGHHAGVEADGFVVGEGRRGEGDGEGGGDGEYAVHTTEG